MCPHRRGSSTVGRNPKFSTLLKKLPKRSSKKNTTQRFFLPCFSTIPDINTSSGTIRVSRQATPPFLPRPSTSAQQGSAPGVPQLFFFFLLIKMPNTQLPPGCSFPASCPALKGKTRVNGAVPCRAQSRRVWIQAEEKARSPHSWSQHHPANTLFYMEKSHLCPRFSSTRRKSGPSSHRDGDEGNIMLEKRPVPPANTQTCAPGLKNNPKNLQVNPLIIF